MAVIVLSKKLRTLTSHALFLVYMLVLLRLTVFRSSAFSHGLFSGRFNLTPGVAYMQLLSWGSYFHAFYLFFGNIAWFMPLGMYLKQRGKPFLTCVIWGGLLSFFIETAQFVLGCGVTETDDLLLNTCGAAVGTLLWRILQHFKHA